MCKSPRWELEWETKKEPTQSSSKQGGKCCPWLSEDRREVLLPAAVPGADVAQQTPTCHGQ